MQGGGGAAATLPLSPQAQRSIRYTYSPDGLGGSGGGSSTGAGAGAGAGGASASASAGGAAGGGGLISPTAQDASASSSTSSYSFFGSAMVNSSSSSSSSTSTSTTAASFTASNGGSPTKSMRAIPAPPAPSNLQDRAAGALSPYACTVNSAAAAHFGFSATVAAAVGAAFTSSEETVGGEAAMHASATPSSPEAFSDALSGASGTPRSKASPPAPSPLSEGGRSTTSSSSSTSSLASPRRTPPNAALQQQQPGRQQLQVVPPPLHPQAAIPLLVADDRFLTFQVLANLLSRHHFHVFLAMDPGPLAPYYDLFDRCLGEHCPAMARHLANCAVPCEMYLFGWMQTVFLKCLPLEAAAWVWDCFLLDGVPALFRTALAIVALLEGPTARDMDRTMAVFSHSSGSGRPEPTRVWREVGKLPVLKKAVESVQLSHATLAQLEDIAQDPCFYRHVQL